MPITKVLWLFTFSKMINCKCRDLQRIKFGIHIYKIHQKLLELV
jgi:hypothetical protein